MTLNALGRSRVKLSTLKNHLHCIPIFQIHHIDYPDQNFTKLKYSDTSAPIIRRGQSHLNLHTDFTSTWLYPISFRHCIRNLDSLAPKNSKLLASHYGDLRFERHLRPYTSWAALNSRTSVGESSVQWWCISISYLYAIPVSPYSLVKRITNPYGIQRPPLDKHHHHVMTYHLVMDMFKNYR